MNRRNPSASRPVWPDPVFRSSRAIIVAAVPVHPSFVDHALLLSRKYGKLVNSGQPNRVAHKELADQRIIAFIASPVAPHRQYAAITFERLIAVSGADGINLPLGEITDVVLVESMRLVLLMLKSGASEMIAFGNTNSAKAFVEILRTLLKGPSNEKMRSAKPARGLSRARRLGSVDELAVRRRRTDRRQRISVTGLA